MDTLTPMQKIKGISKKVRLACGILVATWLFLALLGFYFIWSEKGYYVLDAPGFGIRIINQGNDPESLLVPLSDISVSGKILMTFAGALITGLIIKGLYHMRKLFGRYADGGIFTKAAIEQIRQLGITLLLWAFIPVLGILMKFLVPLFLVTGTADIDIYLFESLAGIISPVLLGASTVIISWVMHIGAELREDQELTI
ncbi:MAG: DUF2975 domain-containing protein [Deltaproteobacteria bacterium]|nr:DUF2975 domain-containing protein [Deltaproteobacteria bacterium]